MKKIILAMLFLFAGAGEAKAQTAISSSWKFGQRQVQGISIPFISWQGQNGNSTEKAIVQIYRAPASVVQNGDGMVVVVPQGRFQCNGAPLTVVMLDGTLFDFPTDGACSQGMIEVHSTQEQAQAIWKQVQKNSLPAGIRQNSQYLVLHSTDQGGIPEFQRVNETSVKLGENTKEWVIFTSEWKFLYTKLKSGNFPTLSYEGVSEESRAVIQIFRMPRSLSNQHGDVMIAMVPEKDPFQCSGEKLSVIMTDKTAFDLPTTGHCIQGMVEAHSIGAEEQEIWKKIQAGVLPQAIGLGEKIYFKFLGEGGEALKKFQQANMADG